MKSERVCGVFGFICVAFLLFVFGLFIDSDLVFASSQTAAEQLTDPSNIVSSRDGLYVDNYEPGRYVYKGSNPNNFIEFNDELWRIVAIEGDGSLKIIKDSPIKSLAFDDPGYRSSATSTFCIITADKGCSAWSAMNKTFTNGAVSGTVAQDSSLNSYMNITYYNSLPNKTKRLIKEHTYNIGATKIDNTNMTAQIEDEKAFQWTGKIGLLHSSDHARANSNIAQCGTDGLHKANSGICTSTNYLYNLNNTIAYWTITPLLNDSNAASILRIDQFDYMDQAGAWGGHNIMPVVFLTHNTNIISGTGTSSNPYKIRYSGESDVTLSINSALSMQLSTQELLLNPIPNADLDKTDMTIRVDTNDIAGYKLVISIASGSSNTSLNYINPINKPDGVNYAISSIASVGDLATNTWGYNLGSKDSVTSFKPIPSYNTPDLLKAVSGTVLNDTTTVTFGGKVDDSIPAGDYYGSLGFSLVAGI